MKDDLTKNEKLFDALGEIDDFLIDEAARKDSTQKLKNGSKGYTRSLIIRNVSTLAACFILLCALLTLLPHLSNAFTPSADEPSPPQNDNGLIPTGSAAIVTTPALAPHESAPEENHPSEIQSHPEKIEDNISPDDIPNDSPLLEESAAESSEELQSELAEDDGGEPSPLSEISE